MNTNKIKLVGRSPWTPPSLRNSNNLICSGSEKLGGKSFVRFKRWNSKNRAFVIEGFVRYKSALYYELMKNPTVK